MVQLIYKGELRDITKIDSENIEAKRVKDVLKFINTKYGKEALKTAKQALITINSVRCCDAKAIIPDNATICFFPFCIGG